VIAGPGDEKTAATAAHGRLRAGHADRDHVIDVLKTAFVQGRLAKNEFDLRVSQTLTSRTYGDLAALTADLPAGPAATAAPRKPAPVPGQPQVNQPLMWSTGGLTLVGVASIVAALPTNGFLLLVAGVLTVLICAPVAGTLMLDLWRGKRSSGQPPLPPAQRARPLEGDRDSSFGDDLTLCQARGQARTRHVSAQGVLAGPAVDPGGAPRRPGSCCEA
jgi:hypothetical protein